MRGGRYVALLAVVSAFAAFCSGATGATGATGTGSGDPSPTRPPLVCTPPSGSEKLPPASRRGLIGHLLQYPVVALATPNERARARQLLARLVGAAAAGSWRDPRAAAQAGFDMRTAPRKPGDLSVRYFHAERPQQERRGSLLDPTRPKALIYANAPGRPLALVGAMWSTRDGEIGPHPGGAITRWHSHTVCKEGKKRGLKPPASGKCPPGSRLTQGTSEMMHVWFTRDLRSAFAIRAPEPELCRDGLLPASHCRRR